MDWISDTAMGSTPANGSSNKINDGFSDSARAISTRRFSPPDSWYPLIASHALTQDL